MTGWGKVLRMKIGNREFTGKENRAWVMGILNVTPDSFSDGGSYDTVEDAVRRAEQMVEEGADIIDIGGESTRPGYTQISVEEELSRIVPVIRAVKEQLEVPVSVDTYKPEVAEGALAAGADMINDIWGLRWPGDPEHRMAAVVAASGKPVCVMHNHEPKIEKDAPGEYREVLAADLAEALEIAREAGIDDENIVLDPGIGFGKTYEENLWSIAELGRITAGSMPVLLGISRKSVIGNTLNLPTDQREEGTIALNVLGRKAGCSIFRVHDVKGNRRALDMTDAVLAAEKSVDLR